MFISGAKKVVFVEKYDGVLTILKKNLYSLKSISNYKIIERNIYDENFFQIFKKKFEIIFLDPPFKDENINSLLIKIKDNNIVNRNGIIILHRHKNNKDKFTKDISIIEQKKYGISKIYFLKFKIKIFFVSFLISSTEGWL